LVDDDGNPVDKPPDVLKAELRQKSFAAAKKPSLKVGYSGDNIIDINEISILDHNESPFCIVRIIQNSKFIVQAVYGQGAVYLIEV
jgi:hypothetical protein